jgi:hypothetical protein
MPRQSDFVRCFASAIAKPKQIADMRPEIENSLEAAKQSIGLLRRHL